MADTQNQAQQQPRGAGNGDKANATRSRNIVDWPPPLKPHEEVVDELEQKAQDNADFNNEMNAIQTAQVQKLRETLNPQGDPDADDDQRTQAREALLAQDPEKKKAALKGEMDARAKRDRAAVAAK